jgi:dienelactone hydrolase
MTDLHEVRLDHAGSELVGRLAAPPVGASRPRPVVLVFPSALGLGDHALECAQALADAGYLGLGIDMYGGGAASSYADAAATGAKFEAITRNPALLRARANAWLDKARTLPGADPDRIAAVGYCFGGLCVLELARNGADLKAVVSYHGILKTGQPAAPGGIKAHVVAYCGGQDPYAPQADIDGLRDELEAAGAHYQITTFGKVQHSFTDPRAVGLDRPGIAFDAMANRISWAGTLALLQHLFSS